MSFVDLIQGVPVRTTFYSKYTSWFFWTKLVTLLYLDWLGNGYSLLIFCGSPLTGDRPV
jgi:bacteriorhodopsin